MDRFARISILLLIVALFVNAAVHFFYTPYNEYEKNFNKISNMVKAYSKWNMRQLREVYMSNTSNELDSICRRYLYMFPRSEKDSSITTIEDSQKITYVYTNFRYFSVGGVPMFSDGGSYFRVGEFYLGSPIVFIDKSGFLTDNNIFYVFRQKNQNNNMNNIKEIKKNGD